jgi:hypothetical protein
MKDSASYLPKVARDSSPAIFETVDELLNEEIDRYMGLVRSKESEFYNKYFAALVIRDAGVRHRANAPAPPTLVTKAFLTFPQINLEW